MGLVVEVCWQILLLLGQILLLLLWIQVFVELCFGLV